MKKKEVVIIGASRYSRGLIERLSLHKNFKLVVIDKDEEKIAGLDSMARCILADATSEKELLELGIENADYYIVGISADFTDSLTIIVNLTSNFEGNVIARGINEQHEIIMHRMGVSDIISPEISASRRTYNKLVNPLLRKGYDQFSMIEISDEISMIRIPAKEEWVGKMIKDLGFNELGLSVSLLYKNGKKPTIVNGLTDINSCDVISLIGVNKKLVKFLKDFEGFELTEEYKMLEEK